MNNLTIILPVYNPSEGWENRLASLMNKLESEFFDTEYYVTIINDGSIRNPGHFIEEKLIPLFPKLKYISYEKNRGKGFAIRQGLKHSSSDFYIYTDFDIPFGIHSLRETYDELIRSKYNLILGKRDFSYFKTLPLRRFFLSISLMIANSLYTRFRVTDTQAGLKGLDNKAREVLLTTHTDGFVFEIEFILKCLKANITHKKVKVSLDKNVTPSDFSSKIIMQEIKNYFRILSEARS